ncbi:MAG: carboxymuconolactone decarboxylase family protein [bacterium]|nr:carboxymuconolactone decarboxylase family protein [bacterium]
MTDVDEHYAKQLGGVPKPISGLRAHAPEFFAGMAIARASVMDSDSPEGLDRAMKELLIIILDIVYDNPEGALVHLEAGLREGLTLEALREALLLTVYVGGIATWARYGQMIYESALEMTAE